MRSPPAKIARFPPTADGHPTIYRLTLGTLDRSSWISTAPLERGRQIPDVGLVRAHQLVFGHVTDQVQFVAAELPVRARQPHHRRDLGDLDGRHGRRHQIGQHR